MEPRLDDVVVRPKPVPAVQHRPVCWMRRHTTMLREWVRLLVVGGGQERRAAAYERLTGQDAAVNWHGLSPAILFSEETLGLDGALTLGFRPECFDDESASVTYWRDHRTTQVILYGQLLLYDTKMCYLQIASTELLKRASLKDLTATLDRCWARIVDRANGPLAHPDWTLCAGPLKTGCDHDHSSGLRRERLWKNIVAVSRGTPVKLEHMCYLTCKEYGIDAALAGEVLPWWLSDRYLHRKPVAVALAEMAGPEPGYNADLVGVILSRDPEAQFCDADETGLGEWVWRDSLTDEGFLWCYTHCKEDRETGLWLTVDPP
jgi:hypothetical protein